MTTYYMRADGTAANKGAASGPGSDASACMNPSVHNGESYSASDIIKVCDDGGDIRGAGGGGAAIVPPTASVTYEPETGDSPIVNGSALVTTWTEAEEALGAGTYDTDTSDEINYRNLIPAATLSSDGEQVRIQLRGHSAQPSVIAGVFIGEQAAAGDAFDMESGTISEFLFSASQGVTISAGASVWSDWLDYSFDKTKAYFISVGCSQYFAKVNYTGVSYYFKSGAGEDDNAGVANVTAYTGPTANKARPFIDLEVRYEDVWQASFNPDNGTSPLKVFFDNTLGTDAGSLAAVNASNEWFHDATPDTLYVYSATDPDTAFTSPGIEATDVIQGFFVNNKASVVIDGIDCVKAQTDGIKYSGSSKDGEVKNLTVYNNAGQGYLQTGTATNTQLSNIIAHNNGIDTLDHGIYMGAPSNVNGAWLVVDCTAYSNSGAGMQAEASGSGTFRRCLSYDNVRRGFDVSDVFDDSNFNMEYCISFDNGQEGFRTVGAGGTYNGNNDVNYYNCVAYSNDANGGFKFTNNGSVDTNIKMRNCISVENGGGDLYVPAGQNAVFDLDYNCYYRASGTMIDFTGTTYTQAQFATYQSAKSQDANSKSQDPLMTDPANADFTISDSSPCFDAGTSVGLSSDYFGNAVPQGAAPDIGIHEVPVAAAEAGSISVDRLRWPFHRRFGHSQRY